jgi:DNA replication protein DnaC
MDKEQVLNNIPHLTAEQLSDYINGGIVTLAELKETGALDSIKRRKIGELQEARQAIENEAWQRAEFGTEKELLDYISDFPDGNHVDEAKNLVRAKREKEGQKQREKDRILNAIEANPNTYRRINILEFINKGVITKEDLLDRGIPQQVLEKIDVSPVNFELGETPDSIPEGYTEVYFWGGPGSGKTCVLSALLSKAEREANLEIATGTGYSYMHQLKNIFTDEYAVLPNPTNFEKTQYLPFAIRASNRKSRSISLIELSGEIFQCFFNENAGIPQKSELHQNTFDTLLNYLESDNRKIHFFFIDFQDGNGRDETGLKQSDYLDAAATYFKNHKIFSKTTDAIYVVLTKSDLMNRPRNEWTEGAKEHLASNNFTSFTNTLKAICKKNSINAGKLYVEPFSIGDVYFRDYCSFDDTTAGRILEILNKRIPARGKSILDVFNK